MNAPPRALGRPCIRASGRLKFLSLVILARRTLRPWRERFLLLRRGTTDAGAVSESRDFRILHGKVEMPDLRDIRISTNFDDMSDF